MSLEHRIRNLEQRANGQGLPHTPPIIFYACEADIPRLIAQATICRCCTVHIVLPQKGSH